LLYQPAPAWTILVKLGEINMTSTPLIILNKTQKFYISSVEVYDKYIIACH
jgi:hypothetical protein